jgi:hypothetical protein
MNNFLKYQMLNISESDDFQEQKKKNHAYVIVNIDGENKHVCINWLRRCNGEKTHCQHSYSRYHGEGFTNMVCPFHLTQPQGCWRNDHRDPSKRCLKKHYPELLNIFPQEKIISDQVLIKPNNFNPPLNSPLTRMMQNIFIGDYPPSVDFKILEKISENEFRVVVNNIVCIMTPIHIAREYFKYLSSDDQGYFYKYI